MKQYPACLVTQRLVGGCLGTGCHRAGLLSADWPGLAWLQACPYISPLWPPICHHCRQGEGRSCCDAQPAEERAGRHGAGAPTSPGGAAKLFWPCVHEQIVHQNRDSVHALLLLVVVQALEAAYADALAAAAAGYGSAQEDQRGAAAESYNTMKLSLEQRIAELEAQVGGRDSGWPALLVG